MEFICDLPILEDGEDKSSQLKNRIRKNYRHIRKWAKRSNTNCFRIYDRDIKEFPLSIDYYDGKFALHFFGSKGVEEPREELHDEAIDAITSLFNVEQEHVFLRTRILRERLEQYEKKGSEKEFFLVSEYGVKFLVNLKDYLDTGLFLDHRETRQLIGKQAVGKRLLNLFAYTGSFSLIAAMHGAAFTKSVDMSNTYVDWGRKNFALNKIDSSNHIFLREDCLKFLEWEEEKYDLIVIDPPTLSRSKKMDRMFTLQEDYIYLISRALDLLLPQGKILFSTNFQGFKFDPSHFNSCNIKEITKQTIPFDFHNKKIHKSFLVELK